MTSLPSDMSKIWEALQPASPSENPSIITYNPIQIRLNSIIDPLPNEIFNNEPWYITSDSVRDTLPDSITPVTINTSSSPRITPSIATLNTVTVDMNTNFDIEQYLNSIKDRFTDINTHIESDEHRYDDHDYGVIIDKIQQITNAVDALQILIEDNNQ